MERRESIAIASARERERVVDGDEIGEWEEDENNFTSEQTCHVPSHIDEHFECKGVGGAASSWDHRAHGTHKKARSRPFLY